MLPAPVVWVIVAASAIAAASAYPFVATAIAYRRRDNGLAYILLALGVGVWNGMVAVQVFSAEPLVHTFFLSLAMVGGLLAGLGWFLFAATASSTPTLPNERLAYGTVAVLAGVDIAAAVTAPVHGLYWTPTPTGAASPAFAAIEPHVGYWLHTLLLLVLFGAGTALFGAAWRAGNSVRYTRAYTLVGSITVIAVLGSGLLSPGGLTVAALAAAGLTTIGWVQARRGRVLGRFQALAG